MRKRGDDPHRPWFVSVLTGSDNERDYTYLGTVFTDRNGAPERYAHSLHSPVALGAPSARAAVWFFGRLARGESLEAVEIWHEGRCGRCGRPLTDPESIERGLGPICVGL